MYNTGLLNVFSRFMVNNVLIPSRNISINAPLCLNVTNVLLAEPLKKKKKMDPAVIRAKEERRKRKLEKAIRRLERHAQQLKPISELEVSTKLKDEIQLRKRISPAFTVEQLEERVQIFQDWNRYKTKEHYETVKLINQYILKQDEALSALRNVSEELYTEAIQIDPGLLPYSAKGPVHSAPIKNFEAPDGEYVDITRKYEGET